MKLSLENYALGLALTYLLVLVCGVVGLFYYLTNLGDLLFFKEVLDADFYRPLDCYWAKNLSHLLDLLISSTR